MLRYSFDIPNEADCIERAVSKLLDDGYRTADIMPSDKKEAEKCIKIGYSQCGQLIMDRLTKE